MGLNSDDNIIFGSEFDPSAIKKGVENLVQSFNGLKTSQVELQAKLDATTAKLQENEAQMKAANDALANYSKGSGDAGNKLRVLKQNISDLAGENARLTETFKKEQAELVALNAKVADVGKTLTQVNEQQKQVEATFNKPITPNVDLGSMTKLSTRLEQLKGQFKGLVTQDFLKNLFDDSQIEQLRSTVDEAKGEFEGLTGFVAKLSEALLTTEPGTAEFKDLSDAVKAGKVVLQEYQKQYSDATKVVAESEGTYKSLRQRLQEYRNELTKLEETGQEETKVYHDTQIAAAKLADQYGDMQQRIRILASDTKNLDFGLSALNAAGAGYQVLSGALQVFGLSSEDADAAQAKLLAIMNLVQGAQQLQNLLLKENVIRTVGAEIATKVYTASQKVLQVTLGATAAASKAANAALIATGVGALIVAIGFLVSKIMEWTDATNEQAKAQARLEESLKQQEKYMQEDLEMIDLQTNLRNEKLKQRGLKENAIYASNQEGYNQKIAFYEKKRAELENLRSTTDIENRGKINEQIQKINDDEQKLKLSHLLDAAKEETRIAEEGHKKKKDKAVKDEKEVNELIRQIRLELAERHQTEEEKETLKLAAEYEKRKAVLLKYHKSTTELDKLYEGQKSDVHLKYANIRTNEERDIMNELEKLSFQAAEDRINNLQNQFERERQLIILENKKTKAELQQNQNGQLDKVLKDKTEGIISPEMYKDAVEQINSTFDKLYDELDEKTSQKNRKLGGSILQDSIAKLDDNLAQATAHFTDEGKKEIKVAAELYTQGKLTYEQYQRELTKINLRENLARLNATKDTLQKEIDKIDLRLQGNPLDDEREALGKQRAALMAQKQAANTDIETLTADAHKQDEDENLKHLNKILTAYSDFSNTVLGFLSDIEKAEGARLDRSISYQEKRVANAKELAEKGNAQELELEQKRLDDLQRKREANARKQLAIDNALRLSQATVAAVSAIAQASATGDPFAAIAAGIAVLAAIAAVYQFASSLQAPVAEFYEGTTFVEGKEGRDKIPSRLTRGEAVLPVETNKKYKSTVEAIYHNKIPAEVLNTFVNNYPAMNIPAVDYGRLGLATDRHIEGKPDIETHKLLGHLNQTMEGVLEKVSNLDNFSLNVDENGFALTIVKALHYENLKWKM